MKNLFLLAAFVHLISGTTCATIGHYSNKQDASMNAGKRASSSFESWERDVDKSNNDNYNDIGAYTKQKPSKVEYAKLRKLGRLLDTSDDFALPQFGMPFDRERTTGNLKMFIPKHDQFEDINDGIEMPKVYRTNKRSPMCLRRCMAQGQIHPIQCHSLC